MAISPEKREAVEDIQLFISPQAPSILDLDPGDEMDAQSILIAAGLAMRQKPILADTIMAKCRAMEPVN